MPRDAGAEDRPDEHEPGEPRCGTEQLSAGGRRAEGNAHHGDEFRQGPRKPEAEVVQPWGGPAARGQRGHDVTLSGGEDQPAVDGGGHVDESSSAGEAELVAGRPAGPRSHRTKRGEQDHRGRKGGGRRAKQQPPGQRVAPADFVHDRAGRVRTRGHGQGLLTWAISPATDPGRNGVREYMRGGATAPCAARQQLPGR